MLPQDCAESELLIVMGTSLAVQPFAGLAGRVGNNCPRLLINREKVGEVGNTRPLIDTYKCTGFNFRLIPLWPCWDSVLVLISVKQLVIGLLMTYIIASFCQLFPFKETCSISLIVMLGASD